jgi:prepilin-type N-terminal cleavage/methylation domain-containing protein
MSTLSKTSTLRFAPRAGFTLIELIAAMAIFMILVGALIMGTNNALDTWQGASSRTRTLGHGRAALGFIVEDLQQATIRSNAFTLGINRAEFDRFAPAPSAVGVAPEGRVIWRIETTNITSTLLREITYSTSGGVTRTTEVLDGVTRLLFSAIWEDAAAESVTEITTNALPAAIDVFLELVPTDAMRKAAGIADPTIRSNFLARQTLPLTTRVAFPHSRVPPLAISTNMVTLSGRVSMVGVTSSEVDIDLAGGQTNVIRTYDGGVYCITNRQTGRPIRVTPREPSGNAGRYTPQWRVWWPSSGSRDGADFIWRESDITISGVITRKGTAEPVAGVSLDFPMAGQAVTGSDGAYRIGVDAGWPYDGSEARVTPVHPRYPSSLFEASGTANAYQIYQTVTAHQTGRNYVWIPPDLVLTGEVVCAACGVALAGVNLHADGGVLPSYNYTTSFDGRYSITVPYGWSGTLSSTWLWNGAFLNNNFSIPALIESRYTEFRWIPTATINGTVYRASFATNTVPVTITRNLYTNCLDRAEIPGGTYAGTTAAINNATYDIAAPHYWYHTGEDRILYINPVNSLSGNSHGVYDPLFTRFNPPPLTDASADFTWVPCDLSISGSVTNNLGGPVANQQILFLSNCLNLAPTNAIQQVVITNIVTTSTNAVTNLTSVVIMDATTNLASSVDIRNGFAFLFNTNRYAFAENLSVTTATNGVYTNWVSVGWSGAIFPVATNVCVPPAVFVTNLISNLTGVVFGGD